MPPHNKLKLLAKQFPVYGWIGLVLITIFWTLNWSLDGLRTHWAFFPLWLGYCFVIDALVLMRKGSSMLTRNFKIFIGLFFLSMPVWWLFELLNWRSQNWFYEGRHLFTDLQYFLYASLNFSIVIPAVFGTAELVSTFKWFSKIRKRPGFALTNTKLVLFFLSGWLMLILLFMWPKYFFVFLWLSVYFILDPVNAWLGNPSLIREAANGNWKPVIALWTGCLICGFFWEMWNYYSYPKWIYIVPFVDVLHVFEMPLLGYLGYLPFSLELYAIYYLVTGIKSKNQNNKFIQIACC